MIYWIDLSMIVQYEYLSEILQRETSVIASHDTTSLIGLLDGTTAETEAGRVNWRQLLVGPGQSFDRC